MKRFYVWLKESNRWKHLLGGAALGFISPHWKCATLLGLGVASALEFKDYGWGGDWDWTDWWLTMAGVAIGFGVQNLILSLV